MTKTTLFLTDKEEGFGRLLKVIETLRSMWNFFEEYTFYFLVRDFKICGGTCGFLKAKLLVISFQSKT